jgi:hypothetical protein
MPHPTKTEVIMSGSGDTLYPTLVSGDPAMLGIEEKA